jgi:hypothetical protein
MEPASSPRSAAAARSISATARSSSAASTAPHDKLGVSTAVGSSRRGAVSSRTTDGLLRHSARTALSVSPSARPGESPAQSGPVGRVARRPLRSAAAALARYSMSRLNSALSGRDETSICTSRAKYRASRQSMPSVVAVGPFGRAIISTR